MARIGFYLAVWFAQATIIALAVSSSWVERQLKHEYDHVMTSFGPKSAHHLESQTRQWYRKAFLDTELVNHSYRLLLPDRQRPVDGMETLAPELFVWIEDRLSTCWAIVYQALFRVQVILQWLPYLAPLFLAALVDGIARSKVKQHAYGYANPVRYHAAWHGIGLLLMLPLFYLSVPLSVHPLVVPIWAVTLSAFAALLLANTQHRI